MLPLCPQRLDLGFTAGSKQRVVMRALGWLQHRPRGAQQQHASCMRTPCGLGNALLFVWRHFLSKLSMLIALFYWVSNTSACPLLCTELPRLAARAI